MSTDAAPGSVRALYEQLATERAAEVRTALAQEPNIDRLFSESACALEDAAGVLLHAATAFDGMGGRLPGALAEQAGMLLALAARFEEAADLSRSRDVGEERGA